MNQSDARRGFSLIEVIVAIVILVTGLVALLALFAQVLATTQTAQQGLIVKQKARETLESILTARSTQQLTFDDIRNVADGGIFLGGFQPMRMPGPDGIVGTNDESTEPIEQYPLPGPDGLLNTGDDVLLTLTNFQRQIQLDPIILVDGTPHPSLRQVTVTIQFISPRGLVRTYQVGSYISRFR